MTQTKCPNCNHIIPLKIVVYPDKKATSNGSLFQLVSNSIKDFVQEQDDPFVRLITPKDDGIGMYIDELEMTNSEFKRVAYAVKKNDWLFSTDALERWGEFTQYRAKEIARNLSEVGLRFVDSQNRSTLLHRLRRHLKEAL